MEHNTKNKSSIAFIVELFMMFAILLLVIVVVTEIFVVTRDQSLRAKHLTEAVIAAENTAEVASCAADPEEAAELIGGMDGADKVKADKDGVELLLTTGKNIYALDVDMDKEKTETGTYFVNTVKVSLADSGEEVYTLRAGTYEKEAGR